MTSPRNIMGQAGTRQDQVMTNDSSAGITRRALLQAFAATALVAAPTYSNAAGFLRGGGDIRRISMYSGRTGERIDTIYWIEGKYIPDAVKEINYFMRDWRTDGSISMALRTIDIMAATHNMLAASEPYMLLSGYRSPVFSLIGLSGCAGSSGTRSETSMKLSASRGN